ncbi:MAG: BamA/TamA family outer membrane protein [Bacteroidota bacterium]|nr:BamA/TamA family outer membrane protein [Bacteroidota bacterium]
MNNFPAKIRPIYVNFLWTIFTAFFLIGCTGLRRISAEDPILVENNIKVNGKISRSDDDYDIMRQRPNRGFGNIRLFLTLYQWGERAGENAVGNWLRNIGEAPTYYDSIARLNTASQLQLHYFNLGYYKTQVHSRHKIKGKKVRAYYEIETGSAYLSNTYSITSTSRVMDSTLQHFTSTYTAGNPIEAEQLENERISINNFLKDQGFYTAKLGWTYFEIDTTTGPQMSKVTCVVDPYVYGDDLRPKYMASIRVMPTYSYAIVKENIDSTRTVHGIDVLQSELKFRPAFLDRQIFLEQGQLYSNTDLRETYKNLSSLGLFQNVELDIYPENDALKTEIKLVPLPKRAVTAALEGLGNNGSLGIGGNLSWDNRNLFKGGELLRLSFGGSLTEQRNSNNNSWLIDGRELNTSLSLNLPTLLLPNSWLPKQSRKWSPKTTFNARASYQFRANEFNRLNVTSGIEYSWRIGKTNHRLTPYNLSLVQIDLNSTNTPFLFLGFQDLVFSGSNYSYSNTWQKGKNRFFLGFDAETGGHLLRLSGRTEVVGIPIAPYVKGSLDFRFFHQIVHKREWAIRGFVGMSEAWGMEGNFVPFEKSFFMGGSNDLRGWTAYHFGPGATSENILQTEGFFAAAPIKLLFNTEYRYTIQKAIKGAFFLDAGNIWLYNKEYSGSLTTNQIEAISNGIFKTSTFLSQLGMNTGFGLRYDLEFLILRADLGLKVHHPGAVDRSRWVIISPEIRDFNLNLGIGYPF